MHSYSKTVSQIYFVLHPTLIITMLLLSLISMTSTILYARPLITLSSPDITASYFHTNEYSGLADEILTEAFARINYDLEIVVLPSERSLKMANSGQLGGEMLRTTAIEGEYPNLIRVSESIIDVEFIVLSYSPIDLSAGWSALNEKSVGFVIGMKIIEKNIPEEARVTGVKSIKQLFNILKSNRIEYAVFARSIAEDFIHRNNIEGILVSGPPLASVPGYIYLNKKHKQLIPELERSLREMKEEGSFQKIVDKHRRKREKNANVHKKSPS